VLLIISGLPARFALGMDPDAILRIGMPSRIETDSTADIPLTTQGMHEREVEQQITESMSARFAEFAPASLILAQRDSFRLSICPAMYFAPVSFRIAFRTTINDPIDDRGNRLLHIAARAGQVSAVWYLLEAGASPSVCNSLGRAPADVAYAGNAQAHDAIIAALTGRAASAGDVLFRRISEHTDSSANAGRG
jgi:hypothetical protein